MLNIENLNISVKGKPLLHNIQLSLPKGEIHILRGPNGVGKSTLAHVLMNHPEYSITQGTIALDGENITEIPSYERAKKGLFVGFQYPVAIPGLKISEYLKALYSNIHGENLGVSAFRKMLKPILAKLNLDISVLSRYLNEGFSGGEKKRLEVLQLCLMKPKVAILDEIDSGMDIDGQKLLTPLFQEMAKEQGTSFLIITHYEKLVENLQPQKIHDLQKGTISVSGNLI